MTASGSITADDRFLTYMGRGPQRMVHWEHWSNPDAETYLTGIDYYDHPRECRQRLAELYPELDLPIPASDAPLPRPRLGPDGQSSDGDHHTVRWGESETGSFVHGETHFSSLEEVLDFSPLAHAADFAHWPICESRDYSDEEALYRGYRANYPAEWGDRAPEGSSVSAFFYNTTFMWPLLCFGWDYFMRACLDERFERVMDEFAEINRRLFRTFARLPINFVICHDDIFTTRGPVCSPAWMRKFVFPRYEEYWGMLRDAGKEVIFMADGRADVYVDNVMACGARGVITEPYTDFRRIARKHPDVFIAGEGDNRILKRNDPAEIRAMVTAMAETGRMSGGYMMCIGNHIPWDIPAEAIKCYLDCSRELARR